MTLTGRVESHAFADILRNLVRNRESALLTLTREGVSKVVHVQSGRVIFAQSSDRDDRLGECLLREGMISVEQYEQSGKLIRPGKRQGTILVELGYITPAELVKGVKIQVEHVVTDLLSWRQGEYRIEVRELDVRDIITINISTENLLFHGVKRGAGWSQVIRGLGGTLDSVLSRAQDFDTKLYKLDLSEDESHVVSLVNGRLSAAQICSMSYLSNHDTCLTLYALACCGVVEPGGARDAESLFREQVAEAEMQEIRDALAAFNAGLARAASILDATLGERAEAALDAASASILDEHWDVLRQTRLADGVLEPAIVLENLAEIDSGSRGAATLRALRAATEAVIAAGGEASARVAEAFGAPADPRRAR